MNHTFFDNPNDPDGWSMINAFDTIPSYDKRSYSAAGPFELPVNEPLTLDVAYSFHRQPGADHLENVDIALSEIPLIREFYDAGLAGGGTQVVDTKVQFNPNLFFSVEPNPNNGLFNLTFGNNHSASQIIIYDFSGKNIYLKKIPAHSTQLNINLKNKLSAGMYFIKWTLEDGQFVTKKVVVK